ncbi:MAG: biotin/lipoyl-binding protein, partial [Nitrospira sp. LK70]|nr:biotin/lipoyl-binding protein [Nitrospira sp. LK70]
MKVELPFLAEGIEGGDVVLVLVHEGDQVSEGQSLVELETDKATVPVPSPAAGMIVRLLVREGDHVKVGQALVELDGAYAAKQSSKALAPEKPVVAPASPPPSVESAQGEALERGESTPAASSTTAQSETEQPSPAPLEEKTVATPSSSVGPAIPAPPSVRRLARELAVDLTQVKGSEAGGRITAEDVKAFVRERTRRTGVASAAGASKSGGVFTTTYGNERREPLPSLRRKIAANMTQSWTTIPHVHQFQDADITDLMELH